IREGEAVRIRLRNLVGRPGPKLLRRPGSIVKMILARLVPAPGLDDRFTAKTIPLDAQEVLDARLLGKRLRQHGLIHIDGLVHLVEANEVLKSLNLWVHRQNGRRKTERVYLRISVRARVMNCELEARLLVGDHGVIAEVRAPPPNRHQWLG